MFTGQVVKEPEDSTVSNPFVTMRESRGFTLTDLVNLTGLSRNSIIRTEQGQYTEPPKALVDFYFTNQNLNQSFNTNSLNETTLRSIYNQELLSEYNRYKTFKRKANYGLLKDDVFSIREVFTPYLLLNAPVGAFSHLIPSDHPFIAWRLGSGVKALNTIAKAFCLHQGDLFRYEKQPHKCNETPPPIIAALKVAGYSVDTCSTLELAFQAFKNKIRNDLVVTYPDPDSDLHFSNSLFRSTSWG